MNIDSEQKCTQFFYEVYLHWHNGLGGNVKEFTSIDFLILNRILFYYDENKLCGLKELNADLNLENSILSKHLKKISTTNFVNTINQGLDKRRRFFKPSVHFLNARKSGFKKISEKFEQHNFKII